jgi:hypothetical protein
MGVKPGMKGVVGLGRGMADRCVQDCRDDVDVVEQSMMITSLNSWNPG